MPNPTVALRLNEDTQNRLKALGQRRDRSPHYLMKEAVEKYLATEEALEAERDLMQARWERFELTGETVTHDDVKAWAAGLAAKSDHSQS
ncbi:CopG family transcriptional regulator [Nioella sp. MMSF_3534]|uniref:CopG family ribbon-helix-helix protein n=1 Tax=Nioella sp. MMSF_3534 TaxID=3046720 RepID=UPI00273F06EE|nr:CopG family transcriptional regulator [Nioella sp. MMSF_3534]